jgi:hypothetical protein
MSNRKQRRAAMKKGKRQGETYADVLYKKQLIKEAVEKSAHDHAVSIEADIKSQRLMWMSVVALNRAFGFGGKRCMDYFTALDEVANEVEAMAKEHGGLYARAKLMEAASKITDIEFTPIHEEEMRKARIENEAKGIYFPEDDPDKW